MVKEEPSLTVRVRREVRERYCGLSNGKLMAFGSRILYKRNRASRIFPGPGNYTATAAEIETIECVTLSPIAESTPVRRLKVAAKDRKAAIFMVKDMEPEDAARRFNSILFGRAVPGTCGDGEGAANRPPSSGFATLKVIGVTSVISLLVLLIAAGFVVGYTVVGTKSMTWGLVGAGAGIVVYMAVTSLAGAVLGLSQIRKTKR